MMDTARGAVLAVGGIIVLVTVATGSPGLVTIPDGGLDERPPGTGNATVTVVSTPGQPTLVPGRQGGDVYYLRVPATGVEVTELRGNPTLSYSIDVDALGYSRSSVHFLGSVGNGRNEISLARDTLDADRITREAYRAQVELTLRANDTTRVVYNETTTVEVQR